MERSAHIGAIASRQHGVITRDQLRSIGIPDRTITRWAQTGRLVTLHPGVFAVSGSPVTWRQSVVAAVYAAGHRGLAAHRCAAGLWRLDNATGRSVEVLTLRHERRPRRGVIVHETRELDAADCSEVDGIPVTSVERTLIDIGRYWPRTKVGACLDDAVRRDLTTYDLVAERLAGLARRGRPGVRTMRRVLQDREVLGAWAAFDFEGAMLRLLTQSALVPVTRQRRVIVGDHHYYIDFFYEAESVGIECDSRRFHTLQFQAEADLRRQNEIQNRGILLLRYTPRDLRDEPVRIASEIRSALATRATRPTSELA